jgi:hypothetical protein
MAVSCLVCSRRKALISSPRIGFTVNDRQDRQEFCLDQGIPHQRPRVNQNQGRELRATAFAASTRWRIAVEPMKSTPSKSMTMLVREPASVAMRRSIFLVAG